MDSLKVDKMENRQIVSKTNVIHFKNVKLQFGSEQIYDDISFDVNSGEFISILGPSGCGKSTSLRIIGGLLDISSGEVSITGKAPSEAWKELSYVFQSARLVPWRNAIKNVTLGMELRYDGMENNIMENRAKELLNLVGLNDDMEKFPSMLSGGERQRVAIARALAVDPKIILMDEPFQGLDIMSTRDLQETIVNLQTEDNSRCCIISDHAARDLLAISDRAIILANKKIIAQGTPTELINNINAKNFYFGDAFKIS